VKQRDQAWFAGFGDKRPGVAKSRSDNVWWLVIGAKPEAKQGGLRSHARFAGFSGKSFGQSKVLCRLEDESTVSGNEPENHSGAGSQDRCRFLFYASRDGFGDV
jgi:hypothetical protein